MRNALFSLALLVGLSISSPAQAGDSPMGPGRAIYRFGWVQFGVGTALSLTAYSWQDESLELAGAIVGTSAALTMNVGARMSVASLRNEGFEVTSLPSNLGFAATGIYIVGPIFDFPTAYGLGAMGLPALQMVTNYRAVHMSGRDLPEEELEEEDISYNQQEKDEQRSFRPSFALAPLVTLRHSGLVLSGTF